MTGHANDLEGLRRSGGGAAAPVVSAPPRRWKTRVLLPGAILALVAALLLLTSIEAILPATPVRVVPVVVKTVEGAAGAVTVQAPGWLEPDPHPYYVPALADGVVAKVHVLEGETVETGQVVATLVDDDARLALRRAEADVHQRGARLKAAQATLTAARTDLENLVERTRAVSVGEAKVKAAEAELTKLRADVAIERAQLLEVQDELERKSKLVESQAVSEAVVARLRLRVEAQRATVDATEAQVGIFEARLQQARAELASARAHVELLIEEREALGLAEAAVSEAEAAVRLAEVARDEAALRLDRMQVRSPVAGIVMRRLASPGSKLTREGGEHSGHVVHVYDPAHMQMRVDVPLADAANVLVGQAVEITVEVLPDRRYRGRVSRIVHEADIQKNTVEVKVAIEDPTSELKPEMLARAKFLARAAGPDGSVRQRVFAPDTLIVRGAAGESTVLVVTSLLDDRGRVEARSIVTGARQLDGWIEVDSGLHVGDLMVDPAAGVEAGDRVRVVGESALGSERRGAGA